VSRKSIIEKVESSYKKENLPQFKIGDTVRVMVKVIEGDKSRDQAFEGVAIARNGTGVSETFTVRKISHGHGVERVFLINSPRISAIEVVQAGKVRKAKLYYLRDRTGKGAKIKQRFSKSEADASV
jgi:large subunit ribosomal protein L19